MTSQLEKYSYPKQKSVVRSKGKNDITTREI